MQALVPAHYRVDLDRLRRVASVETLRLAREEEIASLYPDFEVGAAPPFGTMYGHRVFVEQCFVGEPEMVFDAGTHTVSLCMHLQRFRRDGEAGGGSVRPSPRPVAGHARVLTNPESEAGIQNPEPGTDRRHDWQPRVIATPDRPIERGAVTHRHSPTSRGRCNWVCGIRSEDASGGDVASIRDAAAVSLRRSSERRRVCDRFCGSVLRFHRTHRCGLSRARRAAERGTAAAQD